MRALNAEEIMVEVLYCWLRFYWNSTLWDIRCFLEPKLLGKKFSERNIAAMNKEALDWIRTELTEEAKKSVITEYYQLRLVA